MDNITNTGEYFDEIKFLCKQYNTFWEHSTLKSTPAQFLSSTKIQKPWGQGKFNYYKNKQDISSMLEELKTKVPLMSAVRIFLKKQNSEV